MKHEDKFSTAIHDQGQAVYRWVLREPAITRAGPEPKMPVEPVTPAMLR